jgi:murein DD-endopeptidase MepM/ murein hydrolase activator NlpD
MSTDVTTPIAATAPTAAADSSQPTRAQIARLAQEFESMLLAQMLREMRRSMVDDSDEDSGLGGSTLTDVGDGEFARALSAQGGVGLTSSLLQAFERQLAAVSTSSGSQPPQAASGAADAGVHPAVDAVKAAYDAASPSPVVPSAETVGLVSGSAPVSSAFGWRNDPITGARRFHQGVDVAMAYGHDVKAAASGQVIFSGVQNGYGHTVVIDHGDGRQTRYAHLSDQSVQVGDSVSEGQVIGKSGNSGRSTGPHLHFEMTVQGKPVDPRGMSAD